MKPISSNRKSELGEGNVGNLVKLAVFALLAIAAFNVAPAYIANWKLEDRLGLIAGGFPPNQEGDKRALAAVEQAIDEAGLREFLPVGSCTVTSAGGLGGLRTVSCAYDRLIKVLPGMAPKTKRFEHVITKPMF